MREVTIPWIENSGGWIRQHVGTELPLGPLGQRPHALLLALGSAFRSAAPKLVFWGDSHLTYYNDAFAALSSDFGVAALGHPFSSFPQDTWLPLKEPLEKALRGAGYQSVHIRIPGENVGSGSCLHLFLTPVYDLDNCPGGVLVDVADCAECRGVTDLELIEWRSLQHLLAEAPIIVAYGIGQHFKLKFANRAFRDLLGAQQPNDGLPDEPLLIPLQHRFRKMIQQAFSTKSVCAADGIKLKIQASKRRTAHTRFVDFHCQPIIGNDGQVAGVLCTGVDVTDKILAQDESERLRHQVLHASRINAMGTLAMTLAHELSQPLAAAVNFVGASRKLMESTDTAKREYGQSMLGRSIQQILRAGEIIQRMRSIIRSGAANRRPVDVAGAAGHAWRLVAAESPGMRLAQDFTVDARIVLADEVQLEQILLNLFRNAVEASEENHRKRIELTATRMSERRVRIRVRDYGCGLPESWAKDFPPANLPEDTRGLGIGLLLSRTLAKANGGTLHACNADGVGAIFDIELDVPD